MKQMSTKKRALEDGNNEQQAKRQKIEHNEVHPFDLPELVETIVSHLLTISPLSILNILCLSKKLQDVISSKSFWLRQGFKQLCDAISNDVVPSKYLRAVLSQLKINAIKQQRLHWKREAYYLNDNNQPAGNTEDYIEELLLSPRIMACKFDLSPLERTMYDTRRVDAVEYLADRYLTDEAHRVLSNFMARTHFKMFTLHELIEIIEISEDQLLWREEQYLSEFMSIPATDYQEVEGAGFNEFLSNQICYHPETITGPAKFYLAMDMPDPMYSTVFHRADDFESAAMKFQIWKRFIDKDRSILIFDCFFDVAHLNLPTTAGYIKFNSKKNKMEELGFFEIEGISVPNEKSDTYFLNLIEYRCDKDEAAKLASEIQMQLFGDWAHHFRVTKKPPPEKYFKNVKFRRTESDIDFETNLCKVHSAPANIFFESVLPYLVNYPKSFLTFTGLCKSFRDLIYTRDFWNRLGFVHFAEWYCDYEASGLRISRIRRMLRAIRRDFVHEQALQADSQIQYQCYTTLPKQFIEDVNVKLFGHSDKPDQFHGVRVQEYLANNKISDEFVRLLVWLKREIAAEVVTLEDLIEFIERDKNDKPGPSELITQVELTVPDEQEQDNYLMLIQRDLPRGDWDYHTLLKIKHTFTSRPEVSIEEDGVVFVSVVVSKVFIGEHRSVLFIQSHFNVLGRLSEEQFYIKYDKSKNLIEEFGTLSTFRTMNCPNETNKHTVICMMLEKPGEPVGFTNSLLFPNDSELWQEPLPEYHVKNVKFRK